LVKVTSPDTVPGAPQPLVTLAGSTSTPDTKPMPRTVIFQVPALPGALVLMREPSSGSEIAEPYCTPSGSTSTSATVLSPTSAVAVTIATLLPTSKACSSTVPTGAKSIANGTGAPPGVSNALALNSRRLLTVEPQSLRRPLASATAA
jgi:hypothetical protein